MPKAVNRVQFHYKHCQKQKPYSLLTAGGRQFRGLLLAVRLENLL